MSESKLKLYNTASKKIEEFQPINPPLVTMYTCGPTVYDFTHVGHLRAYTNSDVLRRTLEYLGYRVYHVMNVTDVGHMTSDEDAGEDKLEVGARREQKTPWQIAREYEDHFFSTIHAANILAPHVKCRATEHIDVQIDLIRRLEKKGYTYKTKVGLTYDTGKFETYADFARLDLDGQQAGHSCALDKERRNPQDFALWVTNKPNHIMQWDSPWGRGFPGWHIECSAMCMHYCGEEVDIHTGGIDHIPVHHTNEIAQAEAATGRKFVRYWFHTAFLNIDKTKMAKSLGNFYRLEDLAERGIGPLALRYFLFGSSYRKSLNFTWQALTAADTALARIREKCRKLPPPSAQADDKAVTAFKAAICDDLNMPRALAVLWETIDAGPSPERSAAVFEMDRVLGLDLMSARARLSDRRVMRGAEGSKEADAMKLARQRLALRKEKKYAEADELREKIRDMGFIVKDTPDGPKLEPAGPDDRKRRS